MYKFSSPLLAKKIENGVAKELEIVLGGWAKNLGFRQKIVSSLIVLWKSSFKLTNEQVVNWTFLFWIFQVCLSNGNCSKVALISSLGLFIGPSLTFFKEIIQKNKLLHGLVFNI